jgi:hypothetical protein
MQRHYRFRPLSDDVCASARAGNNGLRRSGHASPLRFTHCTRPPRFCALTPAGFAGGRGRKAVVTGDAPEARVPTELDERLAV